MASEWTKYQIESFCDSLKASLVKAVDQEASVSISTMTGLDLSLRPTWAPLISSEMWGTQTTITIGRPLKENVQDGQ